MSLLITESPMPFLHSRQLEAIIRIAESQAKMRLAAFATEADVDEALRLFQVSTLDAATSGNLAGMFFLPHLALSVSTCDYQSLEFVAEMRILMDMKVNNHGTKYFLWKKSYYFFL